MSVRKPTSQELTASEVANVATVEPPFDAPYTLITEPVVAEPVESAQPVAKPQARKSFSRVHTAEADKQARALCRSIAKAGHPDEANYLLHHWLPKKSSEFIARAYAKAQTDGAHVLLDMLTYQRNQITKYGDWASLPRSIREALS